MYDIPYDLVPLRSNDPTSFDYINELLKSYTVNRTNECYDVAFMMAYLVFVYWLYTKIWFMSKIDIKRTEDIFTLHSYNSRFNHKNFMGAGSPNLLAELRLDERKYSRIFKRVCLKDDQVNLLKRLTDDRNTISHPNGIIICPDENELDEKLKSIGELSDTISLYYAKKYLRYYIKNFGRLGINRIRNWDGDFQLETELFAKFQLSQTDVNSMIKAKDLQLKGK